MTLETWVKPLKTWFWLYHVYCDRKIPWRRERLPAPVFWPGEFHGLCSPWGRRESDMKSDFHFTSLNYCIASLIVQLVKNLSAMQETWVRSLGCEDSLEKGKAPHSSILAWRIPWAVCIVHVIAKSWTRLSDFHKSLITWNSTNLTTKDTRVPQCSLQHVYNSQDMQAT